MFERSSYYAMTSGVIPQKEHTNAQHQRAVVISSSMEIDTKEPCNLTITSKQQQQEKHKLAEQSTRAEGATPNGGYLVPGKSLLFEVR